MESRSLTTLGASLGLGVSSLPELYLHGEFGIVRQAHGICPYHQCTSAATFFETAGF